MKDRASSVVSPASRVEAAPQVCKRAEEREQGNSKIEIGKSRGIGIPPTFFVTAHSKGVTTALFVSAHSKGVADGQFRPKPGKTRCLLVTAHSKGLSRVNSRQFTVNSSRRVRESLHAAAPDAGDEGSESTTFRGQGFHEVFFVRNHADLRFAVGAHIIVHEVP